MAMSHILLQSRGLINASLDFESSDPPTPAFASRTGLSMNSTVERVEDSMKELLAAHAIRAANPATPEVDDLDELYDATPRKAEGNDRVPTQRLLTTQTLNPRLSIVPKHDTDKPVDSTARALGANHVNVTRPGACFALSPTAQSPLSDTSSETLTRNAGTSSTTYQRHLKTSSTTISRGRNSPGGPAADNGRDKAHGKVKSMRDFVSPDQGVIQAGEDQVRKSGGLRRPKRNTPAKMREVRAKHGTNSQDSSHYNHRSKRQKVLDGTRLDEKTTCADKYQNIASETLSKRHKANGSRIYQDHGLQAEDASRETIAEFERAMTKCDDDKTRTNEPHDIVRPTGAQSSIEHASATASPLAGRSKCCVGGSQANAITITDEPTTSSPLSSVPAASLLSQCDPFTSAKATDTAKRRRSASESKSLPAIASGSSAAHKDTRTSFGHSEQKELMRKVNIVSFDNGGPRNQGVLTGRKPVNINVVPEKLTFFSGSRLPAKAHHKHKQPNGKSSTVPSAKSRRSERLVFGKSNVAGTQEDALAGFAKWKTVESLAQDLQPARHESPDKPDAMRNTRAIGFSRNPSDDHLSSDASDGIDETTLVEAYDLTAMLTKKNFASQAALTASKSMTTAIEQKHKHELPNSNSLQEAHRNNHSRVLQELSSNALRKRDNEYASRKDVYKRSRTVESDAEPENSTIEFRENYQLSHRLQQMSNSGTARERTKCGRVKEAPERLKLAQVIATKIDDQGSPIPNDLAVPTGVTALEAYVGNGDLLLKQQPGDRTFSSKLFERQASVLPASSEHGADRSATQVNSRHKSHPVESTETSSSPGSIMHESDHTPKAPSDTAEIHDILEWRMSIQPHQRYLFDELIAVAHQLVRHLVKREEAIQDVVDDYRRKGENLVHEMEIAHAKEYQRFCEEQERCAGG